MNAHIAQYIFSQLSKVKIFCKTLTPFNQIRTYYVCRIWIFIFDTDQAQNRARVRIQTIHEEYVLMAKLSRIFSYIGKLFLLHDSAIYVHKCTPDVSHSSPYMFFVENPRYTKKNMFANVFRDKFKLACRPRYLFCLS